MLSYAGVALTAPTDSDVQAHLDRWWMEHRLDEWVHPGFQSPDMDRLPIPVPPRREPPNPGVLSWPSGASRWASFHHFATQAQVNAIRAAVGTSPAAKPLVITDGGTNTRTADMFLVGVRPVLQHSADGSADYWLLTLVDERYFWWMKGDQSAPAAPASWTALLTSLFSSVGVASPTIDTVPSGYGTPDADRWNVGYRPIPLLIDAACRTVGLRVIRTLAGAVKAVNYATANAQDDANWAAVGTELLTGGRATGADVARGLPATVAVVFPGATPVTDSRSLDSVALAVAGGVHGVGGAKGQIVADMPATASSGDRASYRDQAAADWYKWQFALTDAVFRRAVDWVPTGLEDRIEWVHDSGVQGDGPLIVTRVVRPPWGDAAMYGGQAPPEPPPPPTPYYPWAVSKTNSSSAGSAVSWQGRVYNAASIGGLPGWTASGTSGTTNAGPVQIGPATNSFFIPASVDTFCLLFPNPDSTDPYGFIPIQFASQNYIGYVSITTQDFGGDKTFRDNVIIDDDLTVHGQTVMDAGGGYVSPDLLVHGTAYFGSSQSPPTVSGVFGGDILMGGDASTTATISFGVGGPSISGVGASPSQEITIGCQGCWVTGALDTSNFITSGGGYRVVESVTPYATYTGGTVGNNVDGYVFLRGLYIGGQGWSGSIP